MADKLGQLFAKVSVGSAEFSLLELFEIFELSPADSTLSKVQLARDKLGQLGLAVIPDLTRGELDTSRRVVFADGKKITPEYCKNEIQRGEGERLEFKKSLLFHHKKAAANPGMSPAELKSDEVVHSALKTIAGFLTCDGGVLYLGVDDSGGPVGIEYDYQCITTEATRHNPDQWQLTLRHHIRDRFKDGQSVNDYIDCAVVEMDEKVVVRVEVASRRALSFLLDGKEYALYARQGNQTVQVKIVDAEEFLDVRRSQLT